ncbi:MAG TPA: hypothetical protein VHN39_11050, partial [Phenylobacterium sp.]|nr:hypothetical protein [Phenylobacterium sp.]
IQLQTNGQVFGQPFVRPPANGNGNGAGNGNGNGFGNGGQALAHGAGSPVPAPGALLHSAVDSTQTSNITAGRDISLVATETIALGAAQASGNLTTNSSALQANTLAAGRNLTLATESGDLNVGSLRHGGNGSLTSTGAIQIDNLTLTGGGATVVSAASDLGIGGGSAAGGTIKLSAGGDVTVNMSSANFDNVTAGGSANMQGGSLTIGTVSAQQVLAQGGSVTVTSATSAGDVSISASGGSATVGTATAGGDIHIQANGGTASLTKAVITGSGVISVQSSDGDALLGLGTGSVSGATKVSVQAGQDAVVDLPSALPGALSVSAGRDATLKAPTVVFDAVQAGRDITLTGTVGDLTSTHNLVATRNITIGAAGALKLADITASSGSITLTGASVTAGALNAGQDLTLKALSGGVTLTSFKAGRDLVVQAATLSLGQQLAPVGRDFTITTPNDFTAASDIAAGRNLTLNIGGVASLKGVTAPGTVDIIANDLTLAGTMTAANVQVESATGALRVGGSSADGAPASGLWIDNAEFGRIQATGQVNLYAGPTAGTARGDLTLLALDVTPQSTPQVNFLVGGGHNALVQGVVAPTTSGGVIHIGDNTNAAWQPTSILVSGTLGSASFRGGSYSNVRAFDDVRLFATQDIIIGSQRFIGLIQSAAIADIEIGRNKPAGVAPTSAEQNRVLVAAGKLELSASGKVVSQNTAPSVAQSVGVFLTAGNGQPDLLIDPPQLVDVYGSFISQSGAVVSSFSAGAGREA